MDGTWQPLEEIYADQIEIEHLEHFRDDKSNEETEQSGSQGEILYFNPGFPNV